MCSDANLACMQTVPLCLSAADRRLCSDSGLARRQNAYGPDEITILTPYTGQLMLLRKELQGHVMTFFVRPTSRMAVSLDPALPCCLPSLKLSSSALGQISFL